MTPAEHAITTFTLVGFWQTNFDNLLILVALLGTSRSRWPVLVGYGAAATTVLMVCLLAGALGACCRPIGWVTWVLFPFCWA